jgi:hypothetical protein
VDIDGALTQDGGAVFNEAGADVDFRVETNAGSNSHALFIDGGTGNIHIGGPGGCADTPHHPVVINADNDGLFINNEGGTNGEYAKIMFGSHGVAAPRAKQMIGVKRSGDYGVGDLEFWVDSNADDAEVVAGDIKLSLTKTGRGVSQFTARAWINFDGTGTIAIQDSHNFSSISDQGTGNYHCNMDVDCASANYAVGSSAAISGNYSAIKTTPVNAGTIAIDTMRVNSTTWFDAEHVMAIVFGDGS